jgi:hypothetical protein
VKRTSLCGAPSLRHALVPPSRRSLEQPARLRRQLVEAAAGPPCASRVAIATSCLVASMYSMRCAAVHRALALALVLVEQRHRADQRQVLHVVAPRARRVVRELQLRRVRVDHDHRPQQPLRVLVQPPHLLSAPRARASPPSSAPPLPLVDRRVCSRPSSTVSTRQRLSSSSSTSLAVVVSKIITGPSTRYVCVTSRPVAGPCPSTQS